MKNNSLVLLAGLAMLFIVPLFRAEGRDQVSIRRVRTVANPAPEVVPGEEVLEVTFSLDTPGWSGGLGWCLRYYGAEKELLGEEPAAYLDPARNPVSRIRGRRFKGHTVFTLLFPLDEEADYLVLALGDGLRNAVILYPYTALLEEFNIPAGDLNVALGRARLIVLEN